MQKEPYNRCYSLITSTGVGKTVNVDNVITDPARLLPAPEKQLMLPKPQMADHHIIPKFRGNSKPYADFIAKRGIDVDQYTISIQHGTGSLHLKNLHGQGKWNQNWMKWIDENPNATAKDIFQKAGQMMDEYGLSDMFGNKIHPYGR